MHFNSTYHFSYYQVNVTLMIFLRLWVLWVQSLSLQTTFSKKELLW